VNARAEKPEAPAPDPIDVATEWLPRMSPPGRGMLVSLMAALIAARDTIEKLRAQLLEWAYIVATAAAIPDLIPRQMLGQRWAGFEIEVGDVEPWEPTIADSDPREQLLNRLVDEAAARKADAR
jgi:hypothetical protein